MAAVARVVGTLVLLAAAAFCTFGFLATFEPPGWPVARAVYALIVLGCLAGVVGVWWPRRAGVGAGVKARR